MPRYGAVGDYFTALPATCGEMSAEAATFGNSNLSISTSQKPAPSIAAPSSRSGQQPSAR